MHHRFESWQPLEGDVSGRANGVLVSMVKGKVAFSLDSLQQRSELFVAPGDDVYEGMIVGENARSDDMTVNPTKKKTPNIRAASDRNILLKPPRKMSLRNRWSTSKKMNLLKLLLKLFDSGRCC